MGNASRVWVILKVVSPVGRRNDDWLSTQQKVTRGGRSRWRNEDGTRYYEWDYTHGHIEAYDRNGFHVGVLDAAGEAIDGPKKGRRIDV